MPSRIDKLPSDLDEGGPVHADISRERRDGTEKRKIQLHPVLIVLMMLVFAAAITHILPAGRFERIDKHVVPGTYQTIQKTNGFPALLASTLPAPTDREAKAAGIVSVFAAIPAGMVASARLFFMIMFVGGTFGILRATGAIDAGVDRLLHLTSGNVYLLAAGLMVLLASGTTALGFSSEYIALIPVVLAIAKKLGLPNLFAPMIIALADFIGYTTSVTNPILLGVAQPLAGVPVFSGVLPRLCVFLVLLTIGVTYVLLYLRRLPKLAHAPEAARLSPTHLGVLIFLVIGAAGLVVGTSIWSWESPELAAAFIALGVALAIVARMAPSVAADAFLDGMRGMLLPCMLIGLAGAISVILQSSQVMDSIVAGIAAMIHGQDRGIVGCGLMIAEMGFGVLIPSASAKAAVSIPILAPIAHLSGVSGQVTVTALLLGSGMTNMITPTNPLLLAFLAAAKVDYTDWVRFIAPLFAIFTVVCLIAIYIMAMAGIS